MIKPYMLFKKKTNPIGYFGTTLSTKNAKHLVV